MGIIEKQRLYHVLKITLIHFFPQDAERIVGFNIQKRRHIISEYGKKLFDDRLSAERVKIYD